MIYVTAIGGSFVTMEGSLLFKFLLLQWIVDLSLWNVSVVDVFVTPMNGCLVIMEGNLLSRFLLFQWMVALSLWKVVCCIDFSYSNGW